MTSADLQLREQKPFRHAEREVQFQMELRVTFLSPTEASNTTTVLSLVVTVLGVQRSQEQRRFTINMDIVTAAVRLLGILVHPVVGVKRY